jgi:hypothetical protein
MTGAPFIAFGSSGGFVAAMARQFIMRVMRVGRTYGWVLRLMTIGIPPQRGASVIFNLFNLVSQPLVQIVARGALKPAVA